MATRLFVVLALVALIFGTLGVASTRDSLDNVREVAIDASVTDKNGNPVVGLKPQNFRVFVDGIEQTVTRVCMNSKPLAAVILLEFRNSPNYVATDVIETAADLVNSLRSDDWIALVVFDTVPDIAVDFTHDKTEVVGALERLRMPGSENVALYDSLHYVLSRMAGIAEKKAIVLIGTGFDTGSYRRTYGDALKKAEAADTLIYTVDVGRGARSTMPDPYPGAYPDPSAQFRLNDAANTLASFAEVSGGLSFEPLFEGQYRSAYERLNSDVRHQYTVTFISSTAKTPGKLRKLKIEATGDPIDPDAKPVRLKVRHKKGYH